MDDGFALTLIFYEIIGISITIISGLLFVFVRSKRQLYRLKRQLGEIANSHHIEVAKFLQREIQTTEQLLDKEHSKGGERHNVIEGLELRHHVLIAEKQALIKKGESPSDINSVYRTFKQQLFYIKKNHLQRIKPTLDQAHLNSDGQIKKLKKYIAMQQEAIKRLRAELESKEAQQLADDLFEQNKNQCIENIESSLNEAQKIYRDLNEEQCTGKLSPKSSTANVVQRSESFRSKAGSEYSDNERLKDMLARLKSQYGIAIKEVDKLSEANRNKRNIIMKLETQFAKQGTAPSDDLVETIKKLKLQLRDSEMCTAILEQETDALRHKIDDIQHQGAVESTDQTAQDLVVRGDDLSDLLMDGISNLSATVTANDIESTILNTVTAMKIEAVLLTRVEKQERWSAVNHTITSEDKTIIKTASKAVSQSWVQLPQGVMLNLENCCFFICNGLLDGDIDLVRVAKLFVVASSAINRVQFQEATEKQSQFLKTLTGKAKKSIQSLDAQNKYISDEANKITESFITNLNEFVENLTLTELQQELFQDIEHEFKGRLELLLLTGSTMDESFVELIELLGSRLGKSD